MEDLYFEDGLQFETSFGKEALENIEELDEQAEDEELYMEIVQNAAIRAFFERYPEQRLYQLITSDDCSEYYVKLDNGTFHHVFTFNVANYF